MVIKFDMFTVLCITLVIRDDFQNPSLTFDQLSAHINTISFARCCEDDTTIDGMVHPSMALANGWHVDFAITTPGRSKCFFSFPKVAKVFLEDALETDGDEHSDDHGRKTEDVS